jgi:hypothetical protein
MGALGRGIPPAAGDCVMALLLAGVALACSVSVVLALLVGRRLAGRLDAAERRIERLQSRSAAPLEPPAWVNGRRRSFWRIK